MQLDLFIFSVLVITAFYWIGPRAVDAPLRLVSLMDFQVQYIPRSGFPISQVSTMKMSPSETPTSSSRSHFLLDPLNPLNLSRTIPSPSIPLCMTWLSVLSSRFSISSQTTDNSTSNCGS